ncbi:MAG: hypothetical protein PF961_21935 [Planctomycetota bacterium]|jgi:hypothetical protein|nr:hypothetical protein [Planctomycetota bacterium]
MSEDHVGGEIRTPWRRRSQGRPVSIGRDGAGMSIIMRTSCIILALAACACTAAVEDPLTNQIAALIHANNIEGLADIGSALEKAIVSAKEGELSKQITRGMKFADQVTFGTEPNKVTYNSINDIYRASLNRNTSDSKNPDVAWVSREQVARKILRTNRAYYDTLTVDRGFPYIKERVDMVNGFIQELKSNQVENYDPKNAFDSMPEELLKEHYAYKESHPYSGVTRAAGQHYRNQFLIHNSLPNLQNDLRAFITKKYPNKPEAKRHARIILDELGFDEEKINLTIAVIERE